MLLRSRMLLFTVFLVYVHLISTNNYPMRTAKAKLIYNSMYIAAYHLHALGMFPSDSLRNCIYQCQNNDYCRTANFFNSSTGMKCSLFEEYTYVGQLISVSTSTSTVISFDLCPLGFTEPTYICFGVSANIQSPITVQQALDSLRLVKQFPVLTYHPIIMTAKNALYLPIYAQKIVQQFDWTSWKLSTNLTGPVPIYSYDMDVWGNLLQTSTSANMIVVSGPSSNWSDSSINYYSVFLSDIYVIAVQASSPNVIVLNSTTGQRLFNYTMPNSGNYWARMINHQLYITSGTGLRRVNLTQGVSATAVPFGTSLSCKEIFVDASGRLYVERNVGPVNNSFVFDLSGKMLANYTSGSKLIVKASKYNYFVLNNQENPLLLYEYP